MGAGSRRASSASTSLIAKAIETLQMVERAFVVLNTGELVIEGEAEEPAIRDLVAAAGYAVTDRI